MRVLVTNDDGVGSPGLAALVRALMAGGDRIVVVAPLGEASGAGAGVGPVHDMAGGISCEQAEIEGAPGVEAWGVDALPALAVLASCLGGFGAPPDVVVSGINRGANTGRSVLHSGTVGAALTAAHFRIPALAVSIAWDDDPCWETAAQLAAALVPSLARFPAGTVLNLNTPNVPLGDIAGMDVGTLARRGLIRSASTTHTGESLLLDLTGTGGQPAPGTDQALLAAGRASVSAIVGVREDPAPEVAETLAEVLPAALAAALQGGPVPSGPVPG